MNTEDQTIYGAAAQQPAANQNPSNPTKGGNTWKRVAVAGTSAIFLGAGAIAATRLFSHDEVDDNNADDAGNDTTASTDDTTFNAELNVAEVDQNLSFADAFAEARDQVGEGGVFHWHGNVYSTYTSEEWDNLTPVEQDTFAEQVQLEIADEAPYSTGADNSMLHATTHQEHHEVQYTQQEQPEHHDRPSGGNAHIVSHESSETHEPEVHFLGVETDVIDGQQVNVGHMSVDDVHVALIDVDNDRVFDVSIADTNHNNQFDEQDTIEDISDQNLSVDQFAEVSVQEAAMGSGDPILAMNETQDLAPDMPDYVNDADIPNN